MAVLDTTEIFHLHDIKNQEELESIDLADVQIVYGSSFFKGLATGGNVSKAMTIAGEKAVYGASRVFTNQMVILGRQSLHVLIIRSWKERLDHLVKANQHIEALELGCEFYHNQSKALVGLRGPKEKRRAAVGQKVLSMLLQFLDIAMNRNFPAEGNVHILMDYFSEIGKSTSIHSRPQQVTYRPFSSTLCQDLHGVEEKRCLVQQRVECL